LTIAFCEKHLRLFRDVGFKHAGDEIDQVAHEEAVIRSAAVGSAAAELDKEERYCGVSAMERERCVGHFGACDLVRLGQRIVGVSSCGREPIYVRDQLRDDA